MKSYNKFLFWLHATTIILNIWAMSLNLISGNYFPAVCQFICALCFTLIGFNNFCDFFNYRKELKAQKAEAKNIELMQVQAVMAKQIENQRKKELHNKFKFF